MLTCTGVRLSTTMGAGHVVLWQACLWGLLGAGSVEGWDLHTLIRQAKGFPWKGNKSLTLAEYLVSVVIRMGLGAGLSAAFAQTGQVSGAVGFVAIGVAAPKVLEQLALQGAPERTDSASASQDKITPDAVPTAFPKGGTADAR